MMYMEQHKVEAKQVNNKSFKLFKDKNELVNSIICKPSIDKAKQVKDTRNTVDATPKKKLRDVASIEASIDKAKQVKDDGDRLTTLNEISKRWL